jgi:hypothetical protein
VIRSDEDLPGNAEQVSSRSAIDSAVGRLGRGLGARPGVLGAELAAEEVSGYGYLELVGNWSWRGRQ